MNLGRLVRRQAMSHPVRAVLTMGAVAVAIFLLCFLRSIVTSLDAAVTESSGRRIITASAVSLFQSLPTAYMEPIQAIDGVDSISRFTWFGGIYKDPENFFAQFGADPEVLLAQYPEIVLPEDQKQAWFDDKRGAIIGDDLATKYGWSVGDIVPLQGTIYPRNDDNPWTFKIHGIYQSTRASVDEMRLYFHWSYLDESLERGDCGGPRGTSVYLIVLEDGWGMEEVSTAIDDYYASGPQRTRTQPEAAFQADFVNMMGNLPAFLGMIGGAVLIAIFFGVVNTMTIAARERYRATGILKSLGFADRIPLRLFLMESTMVVLTGGALGMLLAWVTQAALKSVFGAMIPLYRVEGDTYLEALVICVAVGLLGGLIPGLRAASLRPVDALRRGI